MTAFRVIVTGSRTWGDDEAVRDELYNAVADAPDVPVVIVHGACPGSPDEVAHDWVDEATACGTRLGIIAEPWPADWDTYGKGAGKVRNTAMVNAGAALCLAFIATCDTASCPRRGRHGTHGATDCAVRAHAAGIELRAFGPWADLFAQQALDLL